MHPVIRHGVDFAFDDNGLLLCNGRPTRVYRGNGSRGYPVTSTGGRILNVHDIVCSIFHGPKPHRHVAHHIDGNRFNWQPHNLAWVTQSENCRATIQRARQEGLAQYAHENDIDVNTLDWDDMPASERREVMRLGRAAVRAENRRQMIEFCERVGSRLPHNF